MASSRVQRWAITLSAYQYHIRYKPGSEVGNADALSRLPRPVTTTSDCCPGDLTRLINHLASTAISASHIKEWTKRDPILSQVYRSLSSGQPLNNNNPALIPYQLRQSKLSILDGCDLWGCRVVVPPQGHKRVLEELHDTHPGISKMKALARSYIWWPQMDLNIEEVVKKCHTCQESRATPPRAPLHPWEWPEQPWSRIHLDFTGPYMGHLFLVIVDSHSKWLDVHIMPNITSSTTVEKLREVFAIHDIPKKMVTDNEASFTSEEFKQFVNSNGIKHVTSAPYNPSSNGLAERAVQTMKRGLKNTAGATIQEKLSKFLFTYRLTPHSTTGVLPAELLMGHRLRSRLDLLFPDIRDRVQSQ